MNRSLGFALATWICMQSLVAETQFLGTLPRKASRIGLSMDVHTEAVGGNGYQPMELRFSPSGPQFQRDRHVEVRITPVGRKPSRFQFTYRRSFTLAEGSKAQTKRILVPHYYHWQSLQVELREAGQEVKWGKASFGLAGNLRHQNAGQKITVGIIRPKDSAAQDQAWKICPDVRTLVTVLGEGPIPEPSMSNTPNQPVAKRLNDRQSLQLVQQVQPAWVQFRPIEESGLPETWLGFSQLDVILVAAPAIDRIANEQPDSMEALKLWLASGGNLWIYALDQIASDQGQDSFTNSIPRQEIPIHRITKQGDINRLLDLSSPNDTSELGFSDWNGITKLSTQTYQAPASTMRTRRQAFKALEDAGHPFAATEERDSIHRRLQRGPFGLGEVVGITAEDPFPGSFQFWNSIAAWRSPAELHWPNRTGVDPPNGHDDYWSWLIRSLGQPPVKSFVVLNLLFAIFIGPICYRYLQRRRRLYLLYFVAPLGAALVTGGLFTYAVLIDGVTTKQRTRQLTWFDSVHPYKISQSRSTYYRVLGFGQSIDVTADTAIYPVRHSPVYKGYYSANSGEGELFGTYSATGDHQRLDGGFLPTRNQVQYLTNRPVTTDQSIDVDWETKMVTNASSHPIHELIVCGSDGKYWQSSELGTSTSVPLTPCTNVNDRLNQMLGTKAMPESSEIPTLNSYNWTRNNTVSHESSLERRLQDWSKHLPANSFIGTAAIDRDQLGVTQARMVDSVHVIMGRLP